MSQFVDGKCLHCDFNESEATCTCADPCPKACVDHDDCRYSYRCSRPWQVLEAAGLWEKRIMEGEQR